VRSLPGTATQILQSPAVRRRLQVLIVALVLLFFGLALYSQLPLILNYHWVFDPAYFAVALLVLIARGPAQVYPWWAIIRRLGYALPFSKTIRIVYHSALARYLPGQVWYAVSRVYLAEKEGVPRLVTAVSMGLEAALLVASAALVASLSLVVWRDAPLWLGAIVLAALLALILQPRLFFGGLNWGLTRIGRQPLELELSRSDVLRLLWPFVFNWLLYGVMSFALTASLYPALSWTQAPALTGLFVAAWLIGFLTIIVPQGLVIREGLIFTFLTTLLGVPAPVATATAILSRGWTMLGEGIWAAISTRL
jgi:glycosyltransferase 2 family protein